MSLAETRFEYDDVACSKILAKMIRAHTGKLRERDDSLAAVARAEEQLQA
jgi:hypothetical protein